MFRRQTILLLLMISLIIPFLTGCPAPPPPKNVQKPVAAPPPDYTAVRDALKDPSTSVKIQAVKMLRKYKHPATIDEYIEVMRKYPYNSPLMLEVRRGLGRFKQQIVPSVKEKLWNSDEIVHQKHAFKILSNRKTYPAEKFLPEVVDKFFKIPYDANNLEVVKFRRLLAGFICRNSNPADSTALTDVVSMLADADTEVVKKAAKTLVAWKAPGAIDKLIKAYEANRYDEFVVEQILYVLSGYPAPNRANPVPVSDISIFLQNFGSYNDKIQSYSFQGLSKYGYYDSDGKIEQFINSFKDCDSGEVRGHVFTLQQTLPSKKYPDGKAPTFELPSSGSREGFCSN